MNKAPQKQFHVRAGDEVVVISGGAKGRHGKIARVVRKRNLVQLEGTDDRARGTDETSVKLKAQGASDHDLEKRRLVKPQLHYLRKSQKNPNGGMLWLEGTVHISRVMKLDEFNRRRNS